MDSIQVDIKLTNMRPYAEILIARLGEVCFDAFSEYEEGIKAYIDSSLFNKKIFDDIILDLPEDVVVSSSISELEKRNWVLR